MRNFFRVIKPLHKPNQAPEYQTNNFPQAKEINVGIFANTHVELMLSPQLADNLLGDDNFCLGFELTTKKSAHLNMLNEGSFSWGGYYGTTYWADPKERLICLIMTQQNPNSHSNYADKIRNIIYSGLK